MEIAQVVSLRGTCDRKQVGAVLAREGRVLSVGYNGAPPGLPHCESNVHGWGSVQHANHDQLADELDVDNGLLPEELWQLAVTRWGCRNATHAEANALAFAAKYGVSTDGATLFVTVSPCETCSRLLIAAGIVAVYFNELYRDVAGVRLLEQALIQCHDCSV